MGYSQDLVADPLLHAALGSSITWTDEESQILSSPGPAVAQAMPECCLALYSVRKRTFKKRKSSSSDLSLALSILYKSIFDKIRLIKSNLPFNQKQRRIIQSSPEGVGPQIDIKGKKMRVSRFQQAFLKNRFLYFPLFPLAKKIQEVLDYHMYSYLISVEDEVLFSSILELYKTAFPILPNPWSCKEEDLQTIGKSREQKGITLKGKYSRLLIIFPRAGMISWKLPVITH